ncbi:MAG: transglycosylase domain-containing protein, partial [Pseudomonadota bacterium]
MAIFRPLLRRVLIAAVCLLIALLFYLDGVITNSFEAKRYALPAQVFARPLELFVGARITVKDIVQELGDLGYRRVAQVRSPGEFETTSGALRVYSRGFAFPDAPESARLARLSFADGRVAALSSAGTSLDILRLEPQKIGGIYPSHGEDRLLLRLDEIPETLIGGLLAIEDQGFYRHLGFSPSGIARAALANLRSGSVVAGGSTITQQLV